MSHTPGPWRVAESAIYYKGAINRIVSEKGVLVGCVDAFPDDLSLMASAPDLKAENERLRSLNRELVEGCQMAFNFLTRSDRPKRDVFLEDFLRHVLAKAKEKPEHKEQDEAKDGVCCSCGYEGQDETPCPAREDKIHCEHWWDGGEVKP